MIKFSRFSSSHINTATMNQQLFFSYLLVSGMEALVFECGGKCICTTGAKLTADCRGLNASDSHPRFSSEELRMLDRVIVSHPEHCPENPAPCTYQDPAAEPILESNTWKVVTGTSIGLLALIVTCVTWGVKVFIIFSTIFYFNHAQNFSKNL